MYRLLLYGSNGNKVGMARGRRALARYWGQSVSVQHTRLRNAGCIVDLLFFLKKGQEHCQIMLDGAESQVLQKLYYINN